MKKIGGIAAILIVVVVTGCSTVEPWERERLAHDCMQIPVDADEAEVRGKVESTREGSSGGIRRGGGGCGCN